MTVAVAMSRAERIEQVACRDDLQPMILRLGLAVGDTNAQGINRVEIVKQIAYVVATARELN